MADVRSMLRAERASRRITHPHASYTSAGNLLCSICEVPIKSERAWGAHLHTTQHNLRLGRERDDAKIGRKDDVVVNKKRKAVEFDEDPETEQKRSRTIANEGDGNDDVPILDERPDIEKIPTISAATEDDIPDDELQALEKNLAALEQETIQSNMTALSAPATISAPAMSAHELAAQAREEQSKQRTRRDEEIENEREDAARALEDEFEEMDSLQERVKKLREKREALRSMDGQETGSGTTQELHTLPTSLPDRTSSNGEEKKMNEEEESEDDTEDEWMLRTS